MCIICDVITLLFTHFERVIHRCLYQYEFLSHSKFQKGHRVNEVGKAVGFKTYTHFIRTFTNKYGHSPTKFVKERESLQNKETINPQLIHGNFFKNAEEKPDNVCVYFSARFS